MAVQSGGNEAAHVCRQGGQSRPRCRLRGKFDETAGARAAHAGVTVMAQPIQVPADLGIQRAGHGFEIIAAKAGAPIACPDGRRIAAQLRGAKDFGRRHGDGGHQHQIPGRRHTDVGKVLAHTLGKGRAPMHENRHIGAEDKADLLQLRGIETGTPQSIQRQQRRRRIGTAAAQPAAHRQALFNPQRNAGRGAGRRAQGGRRTHGEVGFRRHPGQRRRQQDAAIAARLAA